jgi:hypothetical protein
MAGDRTRPLRLPCPLRDRLLDRFRHCGDGVRIEPGRVTEYDTAPGAPTPQGRANERIVAGFTARLMPES